VKDFTVEQVAVCIIWAPFVALSLYCVVVRLITGGGHR